MTTWDAIVLAGGRGSRLGGVDKASVRLGDETLLQRVLRAVAGAETVVVVGHVELDGVTVVREQPPHGGPAAAVAAGLAGVRSDYVLLTGCDQPFLADALDHLLTRVEGDGVVALDESGRRQHLMSVVRTAALRSSARSLGVLEGRSLRSLLEPLSLLEVAVPDRSALDIDTWDDHARAVTEEAREMTDSTLDDWVVTVAAELGLDPALVDVDEVLDLASVAAHNVVRPAAPLTTFLAGLAAGRAGGSAADVRAAITTATEACRAAGGED